MLGEIREELMEGDVMEFTASSNRISNEDETFSLRIPGKQTPLSREVLSCRWIPDQSAPEISAAEKGNEREILVTFSEPVSGGGAALSLQADSVRRGDFHSVGGSVWKWGEIRSFSRPQRPGSGGNTL